MKDYFPCKMDENELVLPTLDEIEYIYEHIHDERSKIVFEKRLLYSLLRDEKNLWEIINSNEKAAPFLELVKNGAYIYGAGLRGKRLSTIFFNVKWKGFIDKNIDGYVNDLPVYSLDKVKEISREKEVIVISIKNDYEAVKDFLKISGINKEKILVLEDYIKKWFGNIYFDSRCLEGLKICDGYFLDIGCYNGDDTLNAIKYFGASNICVHAFEPNPESFLVCKERLDNNKSVKLFQKAISSDTGFVSFKIDNAGSRIDDKGEVKIEVTTIDRHLNGNKVGFIKMDIEGFEEAALEGGRHSISRDKPILALSVYHKRSDIWRLPLKVLELNPDYRLKFEQHLFSWADTVMYAIP